MKAYPVKSPWHVVLPVVGTVAIVGGAVAVALWAANRALYPAPTWTSYKGYRIETVCRPDKCASAWTIYVSGSADATADGVTGASMDEAIVAAKAKIDQYPATTAPAN